MALLIPSSEEEVNQTIQELNPNTCFVAECYHRNNGMCREHANLIEEEIMGSFTNITFIRFDAGFGLKGFVETLPVDTYPTYFFYRITEDNNMEERGRFEARAVADTGREENVHFGELHFGKTKMVKELKDWIKKKEDEVEDEVKMADREAMGAQKGFGFRVRKKKT